MASGTDIHDPRRSSFGRDYWLRHCQGFHVHSPDGRIGKVRGVRYDSGAEPEVLEVGAGFLGRRMLLVPVSAIEEIIAEQKRIVLWASSWAARPDEVLASCS